MENNEEVVGFQPGEDVVKEEMEEELAEQGSWLNFILFFLLSMMAGAYYIVEQAKEH